MYLHKSNKDNAIHGVDYTKGIPPGQTCGRVHKYDTKNCRPILYAEWEIDKDSEDYIKYDSLSDREIVALGEPVFLSTPLFKEEVKVENCKCVNC